MEVTPQWRLDEDEPNPRIDFESPADDGEDDEAKPDFPGPDPDGPDGD